MGSLNKLKWFLLIQTSKYNTHTYSLYNIVTTHSLEHYQ